jgi:alginate O-acetyltransferase complex protein AlgJ
MTIDIIFGENNFLFMKGDNNRSYQYNTGLIQMNRLELYTAAEVLIKRDALLSNNKIPYVYCLAPNKERIYNRFLPNDYKFEYFGPTPYSLFLSFAKKNDFPHPLMFDTYLRYRSFFEFIYYKNDSHWTTLGAYRFLEFLFKEDTFKDFNIDLKQVNSNLCTKTHFGDLSDYLDGPRKVESVAEISPSDTSSVNIIFNNEINNQGKIFFTQNKNTSLIKKRLLVVGDSFYDACKSWVSYLFEEVIFIYCPFINQSILDLFNPDIVVIIECERFFPLLKTDNINFVNYVLDNQNAKKHAMKFDSIVFK